MTHHSCTDHSQVTAAAHMEGEQLHAAMMTSCKHVTLSTDNMDGDEVDLADTSADMSSEHAGSPVSKRAWSSTLRCQNTLTQLKWMIEVMELQVGQQDAHHQKIMAVHEHACDIQERTSLALLDILCQ